MSFQLNSIVPWGRTFSEYKEMFKLTEHDLEKRILGCGDGPASFNSELTVLGGNVVSIDPLYQFECQAIAHRIKLTYQEVLQQMILNEDKYVWTNIESIEQLGEIRMKAMDAFIADFPQGTLAGRYLDESLPSLSFPKKHFDLALSSHLLFLYSDHLDLEFHISSINELCRVSKEVRVFPLLNLSGEPSQHVDAVTEHFSSQNYEVKVEQVAYEFQKGGNQMLTISTKN
jgi:hypothetical protein